MKTVLRSFCSLWVALTVFCSHEVLAGGRSHGGTTTSGATVSVSGYYRQNGTYVAPYSRRAPGTGAATTANAGVDTPVANNAFGTEASQLRQSPRIQEERLPRGFTTAEERANAAAKAEKWQLREQNAAHVTGFNSEGKPIFTATRSPNRISRSLSAKYAFMRMTGYPHGRPGYVVDHIIPLKRGGEDLPSNMQWQTVEEGKAKDKWE